MRILFVTERFPPDRGGAAASARRQVAALAAHGDTIDVLRLAADRPAARVDVEEEGRARVYRVGGAGCPTDEALQVLYQTALNLLTEYRHDVVHGFYAVHAGYVATLAARAAGRPSVVSLRGNDVDRAMFHGPRLPFLLWTLEHAGALMGVSDEILAKAGRLVGRSHGLYRVPNAVDAALYSPEGAAWDGGDGAPRPWLGFAGELRLKKGLPLLLDLAARLAREGRGTLFWIGGVRREERAAVAVWRKSCPEAASRVRELPYVSDPVALAARYRAMDLMLFPSLWEGMPNALLEAMACGRPALATAIGACPEVIEDGVSGFLVPPGRLDTFAGRAWDIATGSGEERARIGAAARARMLSTFTVEAERQALRAVYETLT